MLALPLTSAEQSLFEQSLFSNHEVKVTVQILDLNHAYLSDVSSKLVDGQVNIDTSVGRKGTVRSLSLTLLDPDGVIDFDSNSPDDNVIFADRMVKVVYSVRSDLLPKWVDVPVFCGPVTGFARDEALVSVEAQGKESFYHSPSVAWAAASYKKGAKVVDVVRDILYDGGETKFDLPTWSLSTTRDYNLTREDDRFDFAAWISGPDSLRQMYYDARGYAKLRNLPATPSFTFDERVMTSKPKVTFASSELRNTVYVVGGTPVGKPPITATAYAPANHPASPQRLGRNGKMRTLMEKVEDTTLVTTTAAKARAQEVLDSVLLSGVQIEFSAFVIPHLEPQDVYTMSTRDFTMNGRVRQFSIPLKVGSSMTVGYTSRRSINVGRIRAK